jgi:hypothetical protein
VLVVIPHLAHNRPVAPGLEARVKEWLSEDGQVVTLSVVEKLLKLQMCD